MRKPSPSWRRRGAIAALTAILMVVVLAMVAFAVDVGYIVEVRQELQNAADSASLAGAGKLYDLELQANFASQGGLLLVDPAVTAATSEARLFAGKNTAGGLSVAVNDSDIVVGYSDGSSPFQILPPSAPSFLPNTVQVTVRRDATVSTGPLGLFFGPVLGYSTQDLQATATAAYVGNNVVGFSAPSGTWKSPLLPIGLAADAWQALLNKTPLPSGYTSADQYRFTTPQPGNLPPNNVSKQADGIPELTGIYPNPNAPGNFGLVDIGPNANDAPAFWNWISNGPSASDLTYLAANRNGVSGSSSWQATPSQPATIKGGPGLKASDQSYLQGIIGQQRIMPLFSQVSGTGQNATYTIVGFAAVTIMDASLTGNNKYITIQPVTVVDPTVVTGTSSSGSITRFVYRPLALIR